MTWYEAQHIIVFLQIFKNIFSPRIKMILLNELHEFFLFKSHAIGFAIDYLINYFFIYF